VRVDAASSVAARTSTTSPPLGDGRGWESEAGCSRWHPDERIIIKGFHTLASVRVTHAVLAGAHLDHNPGGNAPTKLRALGQ